MHRKLLKYIQDSDVAITILLFAIAGLSFRGVPDNIWNDYLYIDWVFPLASSYILFIIATIFYFFPYFVGFIYTRHCTSFYMIATFYIFNEYFYKNILSFIKKN